MHISTKSILLLSVLFVSTIAHEGCGQFRAEHENVINDLQEGEFLPGEGRVLAGIEPQPIRIYPYWGAWEADDDFTDYVQNQLMSTVLDYLQVALKVRYPTVGSLEISSSKICSYETPKIFAKGTASVSTDLVIMMNAKKSTDTAWLATATSCISSGGVKRPIAMALQLNTAGVKIKDVNNLIGHEYQVYILMHEIFHGLGMNGQFYNDFIDLNGKPITNAELITTTAGVERTIVTTSPLKERLQKFYGCSSIQGGFMEDESRSHWERKFFAFDLMASTTQKSQRVTEFTLAFLEGTGWYQPNYDYAEPFFFGQGQGCKFVENKCIAEKPAFDEYCSGTGRGCTETGRGGGLCKGGSIAENCKYYAPQQEFDCEDVVGTAYSTFDDNQVYGRGSGSRCFSGNISSKTSGTGTSSKNVFCFKYTCEGSGSSTVLNVGFGKDTIKCIKQGPTAVKGATGKFDCPDPLTFCQTIGKPYCPRNCGGRGTCVNGACKCNAGYAGHDCIWKL